MQFCAGTVCDKPAPFTITPAMGKHFTNRALTLISAPPACRPDQTTMGRELGFQQVGICDTDPRGRAEVTGVAGCRLSGEMDWMARHDDARASA